MGTTRGYSTLNGLVVATICQPHALEEAVVMQIAADENVVIEHQLFLLVGEE